MIKMTIDVKAHPHKLKEFLQTLEGLMVELRKEKGNLSYQYQQDNDDNNMIHIRAEWQSWEKLESHLQGNFFTVLLGAIRVLCEAPEVKIDDGSRMMGMDAIDKARKKERSK